MPDDPQAPHDASRSGDEVAWSDSEASEAIEEITARAQNALTPSDRRADYSSISPRPAARHAA